MATVLPSSAPTLIMEPTVKPTPRKSIKIPQLTEEYQSTDFILVETKRLVKAGLYKKAFNLVETFKSELANISMINNIKLCRRMIYCITKICDKFLSKPELKKPERFQNLMNKCFDYLQTWNDLLCSYVRLVKPKYKHTEKTLEVTKNVRNKLSFINTTRGADIRDILQQDSGFHSARDSNSTRDTGKANTSEQRPSIIKNAPRASLYDVWNPDTRIRQSREVYDGSEINLPYHLDEFVKYYLTTLLNWAFFYKKNHKRYDIYYRFLKLAMRLSKIVDSCLQPEILHIVAKIRLAQGCLYSEFELCEEAMQLYEPTVNIIQTEISLRMERRNDVKNAVNFMNKFRATIKLMITLLLNMAVIYERNECYEQILESFKLARWFATKFLNKEDEVHQLTIQRTNLAIAKYDGYLRELGEVERLIGVRHDRTAEEEEVAAIQANHVFKMNYYMYNKFNYEKLNASQFIVCNHTNASENHSPREHRSDVHLDHRKSFFKIKDIQTDTSVGRTMDTQDEDLSPRSNVSWKRPSVFLRSTIKRKSTKIKKVEKPSETEKPRLTSDYYRKEVDLDKEREEFEITRDEENEYIEKLNGNIRGLRQKRNKNTTKKGKDTVEDLDQFFAKVIDKKIKDKEEKTNIKPFEFRNVIKNYGFFLKKETFDQREFEFAKTSLSARSREYLGDTSKDMNYKLPDNRMAQDNQVKVEAQQLEAKFEAQSKVNIKNLKQRARVGVKPGKKIVRFIHRSEEPYRDALETVPEDGTQKLNLANILLKHKNQLGLAKFDEKLKKQEKIEAKRKEYSNRKDELRDFGFKTHRSSPTRSKNNQCDVYDFGQLHSHHSHRQFDSEKSKEYSKSAKNMIHRLMDEVERTMEEDEGIRKILRENKPLVSTKKNTQRFLKVPDELAMSTLHLSDSVDGNRKMWNFSQVVKSAQAVFKKSALSKTPKHS